MDFVHPQYEPWFATHLWLFPERKVKLPLETQTPNGHGKRGTLLGNVDPGLISPSHFFWGGVPFKSNQSPLKGDTPQLID